jgi:hypothetical protein
MLKVVPLDGRQYFIQFFIVVWFHNFINQTCYDLKKDSITFIMHFTVSNLTKFYCFGGISKFNHLALSVCTFSETDAHLFPPTVPFSFRFSKHTSRTPGARGSSLCTPRLISIWVLCSTHPIHLWYSGDINEISISYPVYIHVILFHGIFGTGQDSLVAKTHRSSFLKPSCLSLQVSVLFRLRSCCSSIGRLPSLVSFS